MEINVENFFIYPVIHAKTIANFNYVLEIVYYEEIKVTIFVENMRFINQCEQINVSYFYIHINVLNLLCVVRVYLKK